MSRIVEMTDGAELNDIAFFDNSPTNIIINTSIPRSGAKCYQVNADGLWKKNIPSALSELFFRFAFRLPGLGWGLAYPLQFINADSVVVAAIGINQNAGDGRIFFTVNGTTYYTQTILGLNDWHLIEFHEKVHTSGICEVKYDGIVIGTFSGNTTFGGDNKLYFVGGTHANTPYSYYYDDFGADDADWVGDGHIVLANPDGNGDVSQFSGSDGNSVDNYQMVDETPADGDTTYIYDNVTGHQDMHTLTSPTIPANTIIRGVFTEVRAKDAAASGAQLKLGGKIGSTVYSDTVTLSGVYTRQVGQFKTVNPDTTDPWLATDIDSLQSLVEIP